MFFAHGIRCVADVLSVSPSSNPTCEKHTILTFVNQTRIFIFVCLGGVVNTIQSNQVYHITVFQVKYPAVQSSVRTFV